MLFRSHLRMNKEGPKLLGDITEGRPVLGEPMSWKGKSSTPSKAALPVVARTSVGGQLWGHGGRTIIEEFVTSALNARSWQSGRINKRMTHKQCHLVCCNSQQVALDGQDEWSRRIALDGTGTQVATCMLNRWTVKMNGARGYIIAEISQGGRGFGGQLKALAAKHRKTEKKKNSSSD